MFDQMKLNMFGPAACVTERAYYLIKIHVCIDSVRHNIHEREPTFKMLFISFNLLDKWIRTFLMILPKWDFISLSFFTVQFNFSFKCTYISIAISCIGCKSILWPKIICEFPLAHSVRFVIAFAWKYPFTNYPNPMKH